MKKPLMLVVALFLAACASTEERRNAFNASMDGWVGKSVDDLVLAKGPPKGTYQLSTGQKVLEYQVQEKSSGGGTSFGAGAGIASGGGSSGMIFMPSIMFSPGNKSVGCKVQFTASPKGVVESWKAEGENCY